MNVFDIGFEVGLKHFTTEAAVTTFVNHCLNHDVHMRNANGLGVSEEEVAQFFEEWAEKFESIPEELRKNWTVEAHLKTPGRRKGFTPSGNPPLVRRTLNLGLPAEQWDWLGKHRGQVSELLRGAISQMMRAEECESAEK